MRLHVRYIALPCDKLYNASYIAICSAHSSLTICMQQSEHIQLPNRWYRRFKSPWLLRELIIVNRLAWPSVLSSLGIETLTFVSLIFTGHIGGGVYLDGAALALSFANVTGTSIVIGLSSGMDTLCSQAYGGKNFRLVGVYFQRAILICTLACFPIWALWLNAEPILLLLHQDRGVAAVTGKYLRILCVAKPAVIIDILSIKFLQTQNVVMPTIFLTGIGNVVNVLCHYILVVRLEYGVEGAAISLSITYWSLAAVYVCYIRCSSLYNTSWPGWGMDAFGGWLHYCKYGIPGLVMLCLEWWTFEIGYLIVGATSPEPRIEIGIYSIMLKLSDILYSIPIGFTVAATVRVGNLLGANCPVLARKAAFLCLLIIFLNGIHFSVLVLLLRSYIPLLFTRDRCIIAGTSGALFITAVYENADGFKELAGGVLKGCGRQGIASVTNLFIYEVIATPLAICLSVVVKLHTKGYWIGMATGIILQAIIYFILVLCTDWRQVAESAQENIKFPGRNTVGTISESDPLTESNKRRYCRWCECTVKLFLVTILLSSFAIGLAFSFRQSPLVTLGESGIYNNSSINNTLLNCPY